MAGRCYEFAVNALMEGRCQHILDMFGDGTRAVLAHGFPIGNGEIAGVKFGHAWLEIWMEIDGQDHPVLAVDCGSLKPQLKTFPIPIYYRAGSIVRSECRFYEVADMYKMVARYKHYGHWHPAEAVPEGVA